MNIFIAPVFSLPPFVGSTVTVKVEYGSTAMLTIAPTSQPVQWWDDGAPISSGGRYTINSNGGLMISNVILNDTGIFQVDITSLESPRIELKIFRLEVLKSKHIILYIMYLISMQ